MRRAAALTLAALFCGGAWADDIRLSYTSRVMGFTVAWADVTATLGEGRYDIRVTGANTGLADLFGSLSLSAAAWGGLTPQGVEPWGFGTDNLYDGERRRTRLSWNDDEAVPESIEPSLAAEERTPIPDDARDGAFDPISAMLAVAYGPASEGRCAGSVEVYDGRRSYTLTLSGGAAERIEIGDVEIDALKCALTYLRTGGKAPGGWLSSSTDREEAEIWFWRDASGRALPVRIEGDAPIGSAVAELKALPR